MGATAKTIERDRKIVEFIKEKSRVNETVTKSQLEKYMGLSGQYVVQIMHGLMRSHKEIQRVSKAGIESEYKWVEDLPVKPKNHEGYPDPTAAAAINNVIGSNPDIGPGEVWGTQESNGSTGLIYTLNSLNGACQCIKLYHDTEENRNIVGANPFRVTVLGRDYIGDPTHVTFKPLRYCIRRRAFSHASKLKEAREALAKIFGIPNIVEKVPEVQVVYRDKIVYKDREPVKEEAPKIPENYVDAKSAYIISLEMERDIWKEVATKLLERNS